MSKTSKKLLKLLQNVALLCYNDYTINARVATVIFVNKYLEGMISMKFIIVGRNIEVTPGLRAAVEEKIGKLDKYFNPDTEVHVTLSVEKDRQKIEVTIPVKGSIIRSEQVSNDMYVSIDLVEEIIERQLKKPSNCSDRARIGGWIWNRRKFLICRQIRYSRMRSRSRNTNSM